MVFRLSKVLALVIAVALMLGFAGTPTPVTAQTDAAYVKTFDLKVPTADGVYKGVDPKGAKVVWWHNHTGARDTAVKEAAAKFSKGNPWGITVETISKGGYPDIYNSILAGLQTKELPQMTVAYQNQAATYQNANALVNLDDFVNDTVLGFGKDWKEDFFQGFLASDFNSQLNQRTGMTVYRSMEVLYYNADAIKQMGFSGPPKTWKEFKDMACKYVQDGLGPDGYVIRTDASFVAAAAFAQGSDIFDYKAGKYNYDKPEVKLMPALMREMLEEKCAALNPNPAAFGDQVAFQTKRAVFYTGSSSGLPFILTAIADAAKKDPKANFALDIAPMPYKDKPIQDVYGASNSIPRSTKPQELAAWLFIRWYTEPEQQTDWAIKSNYFPVRQSTAKTLADYFKTNKAYESAFNLLGSTKAEPPFAGYDPVRSLASKAMNNVLDGKSVDDEFAKLTDDANRLLDEFKPGFKLPTPVPSRTPAPPTAVPTAAPTAAK